MNKNKIAIILGLMCLVLTIAICIQMNTIEDANKTVGKTMSSNDGLRDEVLKWRDRYNSSYKQLQKLETELEDTRNQAIANDEGDIKKQEELKNVNKLLGFTEVKGAGVVITLDDNREIPEEKLLDVGSVLVHEADLVEIINALYNAGADAISINNQRIVSTTEIRCDGNIVRINGKMIGVPMTIKAIGFPERMYTSLLMPGGYLSKMKEDGVVVNIEKVEDITISKYEGVYTTDYIQY